MSYENPEQFVDKQSGQHFRRMQESITKAATSTIASYVDTYKKNQSDLPSQVDSNFT